MTRNGVASTPSPIPTHEAARPTAATLVPRAAAIELVTAVVPQGIRPKNMYFGTVTEIGMAAAPAAPNPAV